MKNLVVGAILASMFSVCSAQMVASMPLLCDMDIPKFKSMMKDQRMVSVHESLMEISGGRSVALQIYSNPAKETVTVVWVDPETLCLMGTGNAVNIEKLNQTILKRKPKPTPATGKYSA